MKYNVRAAKGGGNGAGIANVRLVPFDAGTNFFEVRSMPGEQVVDHAHYGDMGELDTSATESTLNRLK